MVVTQSVRANCPGCGQEYGVERADTQTPYILAVAQWVPVPGGWSLQLVGTRPYIGILAETQHRCEPEWS